MLVVRPEQLKTFETAAQGRFEDGMMEHSKDFSPQLCRVLGDNSLRAAIRGFIERAVGYGFTCRGPIRLFVEATFLFGSAFDTDPQYPWAAPILEGTNNEMRRAEQLYEKITNYQDRVSGPDGVNTKNALAALSTLGQRPATFLSDDFMSGMVRELGHVFPQKAEYVGEAGLKALVEEGATEARKHGLTGMRPVALIVVLMFGFGHGCTTDPLYPWIADALRDWTADPAARAGRLERRATTWVRHALVHND